MSEQEKKAIEVAIRCIESVRSWKSPQDELRLKLADDANTLRRLLENCTT